MAGSRAPGRLVIRGDQACCTEKKGRETSELAWVVFRKLHSDSDLGFTFTLRGEQHHEDYTAGFSREDGLVLDCGEHAGRGQPAVSGTGWQAFRGGTIPRGGTTSDWALGVSCAVAWSAVTDYLVFDSVEEYRKRLVKSRKKK